MLISTNCFTFTNKYKDQWVSKVSHKAILSIWCNSNAHEPLMYEDLEEAWCCRQVGCPSFLANINTITACEFECYIHTRILAKKI
jgi:hypothetical protein